MDKDYNSELNEHIQKAISLIKNVLVKNKILDSEVIDSEIESIKRDLSKNMEKVSQRGKLRHICNYIINNINGASTPLVKSEINKIYKYTIERLPKTLVHSPEPEPEEKKDAMGTLLSVSHKIPFFNGLSKDDIVELIEDVKVLTYKAGHIIFNEGETQRDNMYYLLKGKILISKFNKSTSTKIRLTTIGEPSLFGEMMRFTGEPRSATIESLEANTLVVSFKIRDFQEDTPACKLYHNVFSELSDKLNNMNKKMY